jgi:hypothetical protein
MSLRIIMSSRVVRFAGAAARSGTARRGLKDRTAAAAALAPEPGKLVPWQPAFAPFTPGEATGQPLLLRCSSGRRKPSLFRAVRVKCVVGTGFAVVSTSATY